MPTPPEPIPVLATAPSQAFEQAGAADLEHVHTQAAPLASEPAPIQDAPPPAPQLPRITMELPPDSGLVLVETSHAAPPAGDEAEPQRPRRVRPPRPAVVDEPLQMVETVQKDPSPPLAE